MTRVAAPSASRGEHTLPHRLQDFQRAVSEGEVANTWRPLVFRIEPNEDRELQHICEHNRIRIIDELDRQLVDLAATKLPYGSEAERDRWVTRLVGRGGAIWFSRWVYIPWEAKLCRVLPPAAYRRVITSRNQDKITAAEQRELATKRVGVVGLSVGAEAAFAIAQEHLCGEFRLADFDTIDLSNLNRIGNGYDELGLNKAVAAARRIAKMDPYLPIEIFPMGITEENLDSFLTGLDLVVDECDAPPMKMAVRRRAKQLGINLIFAADERGFLSVEPYASQPDYPPFHGRIDEHPLSRADFSCDGDFLTALTEWMGGWDQISDRSRASVRRVGISLCGYPQLSGEARFAAGQLAHVARLLLLGGNLQAFATHLDLNEMLARWTLTEAVNE